MNLRLVARMLGLPLIVNTLLRRCEHRILRWLERIAVELPSLPTLPGRAAGLLQRATRLL